MKVKQAISRILDTFGKASWSGTVDTIKNGSGDEEIQAIAVTFMATVGVLREATARGANFVITHEPIFYNHADKADWHAGNAVVEAKQRIIAESGVVVWRYHDGMHAKEPDAINEGMARVFGWSEYARVDSTYFYDIPSTTVGELARTLAAQCGCSTPRIVGDPSMPCSGIGLRVGAHPPESHIQDINRPGIDVLVIGEGPEWESIAYVRDAAELGMKKAMILLGHCPTEEGGMEWLAQRMKPIFTNIPVHFIPAGEPFVVVA